MRRIQGVEHPSTLAFMRNFAATYREANRLTDSARLAAEALDISQRVFGNHVDTASAMNELGRTKKEQGAIARPSNCYRTPWPACEICRHQEPDHTPHAKRSRQRFAGHRPIRGGREDVSGDHRCTARTPGRVASQYSNSISDLASLYQQTRRLDESLTLQLKVLEARRKTLGPEHPSTCARCAISAELSPSKAVREMPNRSLLPSCEQWCNWNPEERRFWGCRQRICGVSRRNSCEREDEYRCHGIAATGAKAGDRDALGELCPLFTISCIGSPSFSFRENDPATPCSRPLWSMKPLYGFSENSRRSCTIGITFSALRRASCARCWWTTPEPDRLKNAREEFWFPSKSSMPSASIQERTFFSLRRRSTDSASKILASCD